MKTRNEAAQGSVAKDYPETSRNVNSWLSPWIFGLNQGPIILMIENFQSGLIWNLVR